MKRFIRYGVVSIGIFFILMIVTVILVPILVNMQKYVPEIERQVSETTGRTFSLGPDLGVSFFPWLSISFSDMKIGNPPGFMSDEFIKVRTFEAKIKVLPLLQKKIEISRFVMGGLSVNLEKNPSGQVNWQFGGKENGNASANPAAWSLGLLSEKMSFALMAVTDGQVKWLDRTQNVQYNAEDIMLLLNDFRPGRPVSLDCKVTFDGKPLGLEGKVGPLMKKNQESGLPVDITFSIDNTLRGQLRGSITQPETSPSFELFLRLFPFSPREYYSASELPFPFPTKDFETFKAVDLEFTARGGLDTIAIEKGLAHLDDSTLNFSLSARNMKTPHVDFTLDLDRIDVDRYLPPAEPQGLPIENNREPEDQADILWESWDNISLAGVIQLGEIKIHGGTMTEVQLPLQFKEGVFSVAPATLKTSRGQVEAALTVDRSTVEPSMRAILKAQGINAETLLGDFAGWDYLQGTLSGEVALQSIGGNFAAMEKGLVGEVTLLVENGALIGVDIVRLLSSPDSPHNPGLSDPSAAKPRSEFTSAKSIVTLNNGLVQSRETNLTASTYSLQMSGNADIVRRQLNLQMETSFATTVVGKGGREEKVNKSAVYFIGGTFSEPELYHQTGLASGSTAGGKIHAKHLVARQLPSPPEADVKNLVGKDLVDPAVVAERFRLQPETLRRSLVKKKLPVGTGKIKIGVLREETTLR
jgi:AsmA protein